MLERLGAGGMGEVFAAWDPQLERRVALKRLRFATGDDVRHKRLMREAQAMARLRHPNIVAVHDVGTLRDEVFIAMEYVEGRTLGAWAREKRPWREVVDAYVQAARGLAAAHAVGLVHRDFKPDNAMIDGTARVQVLDFGLVAAMGEAGTNDDAEAPVDGASVPPGSDDGEGGSFRVHLTATGALLGTPAYMAPEQWKGEPADARTDQFSLAVALFEALHGHRPFEGETIPELMGRVTSGSMEPESSASIPEWVKHAVRRALSVEPEGRFPRLDDFIAALSHDPARSRRRQLIAIAVLGSGLMAGGLWWRGTQDPDPCAASAVVVDEVWNETRRDSLAASFAGSGLPYAESAWREVAAVIDERVASVGRGFVEACQATHVQRVQSELALDRRRLCLARDLEQIDALLDVLARAEAVVIERAVAASESLPDASTCTAERAVLESAGASAPPTPEIETVRREIASATALRLAGLGRDALGVARPALARARELQDPSTIGEALLGVTAALRDVGEIDEAEELVEEGYLLARELDSDALLLSALGERIALANERDAYVEARRLVKLMQAELRRTGREDLEPFVLSKLGMIERAVGNYDRAIGHYEEALEIYEARGIAKSNEALNARGNLGSALLFAGKAEEAWTAMKAVRDIAAERYGDQHPIVATSSLNMGTVAQSLKRTDEAQRLIQQSLETRRSLYGARAHQTAEAQERLASLYLSTGRPAEAEPLYREAIETMIAHRGERHGTVALALNNLSGALFYQRKIDEAIETAERSAAIKQALFDSDHPDLLLTRANLALMRTAAERSDEARREWEGVARDYEQRGDAEEVARAKAFIALTFAIEGDHTRGRTLAEAVLSAGDVPPRAMSVARAALAEAARDRPARAARLAREAIAALGKGAGETWLVERMQKLVASDPGG